MYDDTNGVDESDGADESDATDQPASADAGSTTVRHDWTQSDQPSVTIIEAVAAATDRTPTDLPPLQDTLDTDALDTLLNGQSSSATVSFRYADIAVSVHGNGSIAIRLDGDRLAEDGA